MLRIIDILLPIPFVVHWNSSFANIWGKVKKVRIKTQLQWIFCFQIPTDVTEAAKSSFEIEILQLFWYV